jgi:hypothetical protein
MGAEQEQIADDDSPAPAGMAPRRWPVDNNMEVY